MPLDVEYLLAEPRFERTIVYRYRSGVLRPNMRAALRALAARENRLVITGDLKQVWGSAGSLFESFPIYDWSAKGSVSAATLLPALAVTGNEPSAHFVPMRPSLAGHPHWATVEAFCL